MLLKSYQFINNNFILNYYKYIYRNVSTQKHISNDCVGIHKVVKYERYLFAITANV